MNNLILSKLVMLAALLSGCVTEVIGWHDLSPETPARVRPILDDAFGDDPTIKTVWNNEVESAMTAWNDALEARGCYRPLVLATAEDTDVYPVKVTHFLNWSRPDYVGWMESGGIGTGFIDVQSQYPSRSNVPIIVHEFGHALGLFHTDDQESVMTKKVDREQFVPADLDVENALSALGC